MISDTARRLLETPPVNWHEAFQALGPAERDEVARELASLTVGIARAAFYFNSLSLGMEHKDAVFTANVRVANVAREMGYSYPKAHTFTF